MYDTVRKCPNCHSDTPCMGALMKCQNCGGTYCCQRRSIFDRIAG